MLMIIQPLHNSTTHTTTSNTTFLVAAFEQPRLNLLPHLSFNGTIQSIAWQEHWNPFDTLRNSDMWRTDTHAAPKIMVDGEMRDFISRGLSKSGFEVVGFGGDVERVRQRKTEEEVAIVRAVSTGTASAIREMRKCECLLAGFVFCVYGLIGYGWISGLVPGLTVAQVQHVLHETLRSAGFDGPESIVAFGEQAASPHGGFSGDKKLEETDFVLIDVGYVLGPTLGMNGTTTTNHKQRTPTRLLLRRDTDVLPAVHEET